MIRAMPERKRFFSVDVFPNLNRHRLLQSLPTLGLGLAPVHRCQELVRSQLLELVEPLKFLKDHEYLENFVHFVHPEQVEHFD